MVQTEEESQPSCENQINSIFESTAIVKLTLEHLAPIEFKPREDAFLASVSGELKPILGRHYIAYASFLSKFVSYGIPSIVEGFADQFKHLYENMVKFPMNSAIANYTDVIVTSILDSQSLDESLVVSCIDKMGLLTRMLEN